MFNLSTVLETSARRFPHKDALVIGDERYTYAQINAAANRVANLLREERVEPGDRVAMLCPNSVWFPVIYFGILKAGAVALRLNHQLKHPEIAFVLRDSAARVLFYAGDSQEPRSGDPGDLAFKDVATCERLFPLNAQDRLDGAGGTFGERLGACSPDFEAQPRRGTDVAHVLYTSGTTGEPKGAQLLHSAVIANVLTAQHVYDFVSEDTHLVAVPMNHTFGLAVHVLGGMSTGATLVVLRRFAAKEAVRLMASEHVTFLGGVPTMYWSLLHEIESPADVHAAAASLRLAICGGAGLASEINDQFNERYGVEIREGYGLTETGPLAIFNHARQPNQFGSVGTPVWGTEVKLVSSDGTEVKGADDTGEVVLRSPGIMLGYLGKDQATAQVLDHDGWFRTGDVGRRDEDGHYYIVGRLKEVIIRGGYNVYPREIEDLLMTHPAVSLAAVVGVPEPVYGEEIKAFIVREPGESVTRKQLFDYAREHLAGYKCPRLLEFIDEMPVNAAGKIHKQQLH